jgi:hypothetical protein
VGHDPSNPARPVYVPPIPRRRTRI